MTLLSDFKCKALMSEKKVPEVTVSRLESKMTDANVEGDMEVETTNQAKTTDSNEINIIINGKTKRYMHIFLSTI